MLCLTKTCVCLNIFLYTVWDRDMKDSCGQSHKYFCCIYKCCTQTQRRIHSHSQHIHTIRYIIAIVGLRVFRILSYWRAWLLFCLLLTTNSTEMPFRTCDVLMKTNFVIRSKSIKHTEIFNIHTHISTNVPLLYTHDQSIRYIYRCCCCLFCFVSLSILLL